MSEPKGKKALEVSTDLATVAAVVVDVGATGGLLTGGKLLWDAMASHHGRRQRREAERFLDRVAEALGEEDGRTLAAELGDIESPVWDVVEDGYRAMMAAIHEDAKTCIAAVVADYVRRQEYPDRDYQLAGGLLGQCDREFLDALVVLSRMFGEGGFDGTTPVILAAKDERRGVYWVAQDESNRRKSSRLHPPPPSFDPLVGALLRFEYGVPPYASQGSVPPPAGDRTNRGESIMRTTPFHHRRWQRLAFYLAPIALGG